MTPLPPGQHAVAVLPRWGLPRFPRAAKHVVALEVRRALPDGPTQVWFEHPRARVALEERDPALPGVAYRALYRATLPLMRWGFGRAHRWRNPS